MVNKKQTIKRKFKVTSETKYGQARQYGITLKEFERRRKISSQLKLYYKSSFSERKTIVTRKKIVEKKERQAELMPSIRIRKQVVANYVNRDMDDTGLIFLSIRAITINPDITERGLLMAVEEQKQVIEAQTGINLHSYSRYHEGLEASKIGTNEDQRLNDGKVHIELFWNGRVQKVYTI